MAENETKQGGQLPAYGISIVDYKILDQKIDRTQIRLERQEDGKERYVNIDLILDKLEELRNGLGKRPYKNKKRTYVAKKAIKPDAGYNVRYLHINRVSVNERSLYDYSKERIYKAVNFYFNNQLVETRPVPIRLRECPQVIYCQMNHIVWEKSLLNYNLALYYLSSYAVGDTDDETLNVYSTLINEPQELWGKVENQHYYYDIHKRKWVLREEGCRNLGGEDYFELTKKRNRQPFFNGNKLLFCDCVTNSNDYDRLIKEGKVFDVRKKLVPIAQSQYMTKKRRTKGFKYYIKKKFRGVVGYFLAKQM